MSLQCDYNCFSDCSDLAVFFRIIMDFKDFIITHPVLKTILVGGFSFKKKLAVWWHVGRGFSVAWQWLGGDEVV